MDEPRPEPINLSLQLKTINTILYIITHILLDQLPKLSGLSYSSADCCSEVILKSSLLITLLRFLLLRDWLDQSDFSEVKECLRATTSHITETLLTSARRDLAHLHAEKQESRFAYFSGEKVNELIARFIQCCWEENVFPSCPHTHTSVVLQPVH